MADKKAIFTDDDCDDDGTPETDLLDSHPGCLECGRTQRAMKCCTKCHSAFYCSRACFVQHWPVHKKSCRAPSSQATQGAQQLGNQSGDDGGGGRKYRVIHLHKPAVNSPSDNHLSSGKPSCLPGKWPSHSRLTGKTPSDSELTNKTPSDSLKAPTQSDVSCRLSSDTSRSSCSWVPAEGSSVDPEDSSVDDMAAIAAVTVTLRYNKDKHSFRVCEAWDGDTILSRISSALHCTPHTMRLIHRGKQLRADIVRDAVRAGAVFQVIGEPMEDESGLMTRDIEVLMEQLGVERNTAVRALRQCQGDLIDAMMTVGNR